LNTHIAESQNPAPYIDDVKDTALNKDHLLRLCSKSTLALRVRGFMPPAAIERAQERLNAHPQRGPLGHANQFIRLGIAYSEVRSEETRKLYHDTASENIHRLRAIFGDLASPIDKLRNMLDEIWPGGAHLLNIHQLKCFVGVCRYQKPGVDLEPHIDELHWTLPRDLTMTLLHQLSVNVYVQVPATGGELEIWNYEPCEQAYESLRGNRAYGIPRASLPKPDVTIRPMAGDLIIINPRLVHAVRPVVGSDRITLSAFLGIKSQTDPLVYWS
jgi:hypothetical protein